MKTLLDHIVAKKPLYVYAADFKDFPELHHQLEVVKALAKGDAQEAGKYWSMLSKHNPALYGKDFKYQGDYSLFSCAVEMYADNTRPQELNLKDLKKCKSPIDKLHHIFSSIHAPIPKAELIHLIWNEEVTEQGKDRLRRLIFLYKKKFGQSIVSYQETYKIDKAG